ncbi:MAG: PQQ-like beta-propeller repeat protein [Pirellulales bacterium]|nr:PQQ-like beta-propeller repeat protein [Pirellulales bacterium]
MGQARLHAGVLCVVCLISPSTAAENWPDWRGPQGGGIAAPGVYPTNFSADKNVLWKVALPGRGSSTPVIWGDRIFVTSPIDGQDGVICYDFGGEEIWRNSLGLERPGKHANGTGSNPSPVTDGTRVVVYYKSGTVACLDFQGEITWQTNLQERFGEDTLWWDLGTSPVLASGNVVIAVMQGGDSYMVALDLASGDIAWKQNRKFACKQESDQSYATPRLIQLDGRAVLVTWGADHLTGHDAGTGAPLWHCGGFNPESEAMWRVVASPAVDDQIAVVPYGRGDFLAAVRLHGASGDVTSSHRIWERLDIGSDVPTPMIHGQRVLLLTDRGALYCLDKSTGETLWEEELPRGRDNYYASPVMGGHTLYCAREDGVIMVGKFSDTGLQDVTENDMGESTLATPIPIRGKLLVRGAEHLFLIGK